MRSETRLVLSFVLSLAVVMLASFQIVRATEPAETYIDPFEGWLHLDWKVIREDKSHCSFDKHAGCLTITTQRGTITKLH